MTCDEDTSARTEHTPFEQGLVDGLRDFTNIPDAPGFDAATIRHRAGRRRAVRGAVAGIAVTGVAAAGVGIALTTAPGSPAAPHRTTALAASSSSPSAPGRPPSTPGSNPIAVDDHGKVITIVVEGLPLKEAKKTLARAGLTTGTIKKERDCTAPADTVTSNGPPAYHGWRWVVPRGTPIDLTICNP